MAEEDTWLTLSVPLSFVDLARFGLITGELQYVQNVLECPYEAAVH